jgi:predicted Rdx family selenoprotein
MLPAVYTAARVASGTRRFRAARAFWLATRGIKTFASKAGRSTLTKSVWKMINVGTTGYLIYDAFAGGDTPGGLMDSNDAFFDLVIPESISLAINNPISDEQAISDGFVTAGLRLSKNLSDAHQIRSIAYMSAADYILRTNSPDVMLYSDDEVIQSIRSYFEDMVKDFPNATKDDVSVDDIVAAIKDGFENNPTGPVRKKFDFLHHYFMSIYGEEKQ